MPGMIAAAGFWVVFNGTTQAAVSVATNEGTIPWVNWNPGKVQDSINKKQIVWVDYTADW